MEVADAYLRCEEITREAAKNFSYGIRLLPDDKQRGMSALYAFARQVDDIGDGSLPIAEKRLALGSVREDVGRLFAGSVAPDDPIFVALADSIVRFPVVERELLEVVDGCEMDCSKSAYATIDELVTYCTLVAGSIGRLSLSIFGCDDPEGPQMANSLGVGLQITNILRDIVEDREVMGRVYLPSEDLRRFSCTDDAHGSPSDLVDLVRFEVGRAREYYTQGLPLLDLLDRRSRACVAAMSGIYLRLLNRIEADPLEVMEHRVSLPTWEKAWVAVRSLAGARA